MKLGIGDLYMLSSFGFYENRCSENCVEIRYRKCPKFYWRLQASWYWEQWRPKFAGECK